MATCIKSRTQRYSIPTFGKTELEWFSRCNKDAYARVARCGYRQNMWSGNSDHSDPYNALIAEFNRRHSGADHTGLAEKQLFYSKQWEDHVKHLGNEWYIFYTEWLTQTKWQNPGRKPMYLLQYENMMKNPEYEIIKLGQFLGVDERILSNRTHMKCVTSKSNNLLKCKKLIFQTSPFTDKMTATLNQYMRHIKTLASELFNITLNF